MTDKKSNKDSPKGTAHTTRVKFPLALVKQSSLPCTVGTARGRNQLFTWTGGRGDPAKDLHDGIIAGPVFTGEQLVEALLKEQGIVLSEHGRRLLDEAKQRGNLSVKDENHLLPSFAMRALVRFMEVLSDAAADEGRAALAKAKAPVKANMESDKATTSVSEVSAQQAAKTAKKPWYRQFGERLRRSPQHTFSRIEPPFDDEEPFADTKPLGVDSDTAIIEQPRKAPEPNAQLTANPPPDSKMIAQLKDFSAWPALHQVFQIEHASADLLESRTLNPSQPQPKQVQVGYRLIQQGVDHVRDGFRPKLYKAIGHAAAAAHKDALAYVDDRPNMGAQNDLLRDYTKVAEVAARFASELAIRIDLDANQRQASVSRGGPAK